MKICTEPQMKSRRISHRLLAGLCLCALALGLSLSAMSVFLSVEETRSQASTQRPNLHYFGSGRWRADARTLVAALGYLLDPDISPSTNQVTVHG
jgi:hypothetical protein